MRTSRERSSDAERPALRARYALAIALALFLSASDALAGPSRVVLLRAAGADATTDEAANRLAAELAAAGFEVVAREMTAGADQRASLEAVAREEGAFAAVAIAQAPGSASADVWVADAVTGKTSVRTVRSPPGDSPRVLAVRAVELLQASLLEAHPELRKTAPSAPLPADVRRWSEPARAPAPTLMQGFGAEAAIALLQSADGIGPAFTPVLRLSLGMRAGPALRLAFAGPSVAPELQGDLGTATVGQELLTLGIAWPLDGGGTWVPMLSASGGVYHLHATGVPRPPYVSATDEVWSALLDAGVGLAWRLGPRAAVVVEAHALFAAPRAVVTMAGEPVASAGRPSVLLSLGLLASLL